LVRNSPAAWFVRVAGTPEIGPQLAARTFIILHIADENIFCNKQQEPSTKNKQQSRQSQTASNKQQQQATSTTLYRQPQATTRTSLPKVPATKSSKHHDILLFRGGRDGPHGHDLDAAAFYDADNDDHEYASSGRCFNSLPNGLSSSLE
jgi:hypothetical protein